LLRVGLKEKLQFYPGQFAEIAVPSSPEQWRCYSMASAPGDADELEFLIKRIDGGAFSGQIDQVAVGDPLRLRGPLGDAYLRSGEGPVLLVGVGTGLAPLLSMLRDAADQNDRRPFMLLYGARDVESLVLYREARSLSDRLDLTVVGCLTAHDEGRAWEGFRGTVTNAVQSRVADAAGLDAYLCGRPEMCADVRRLLEAKGADEHRIFGDPFYAAVSS
jgi:NAD(P)H-flavin reductase